METSLRFGGGESPYRIIVEPWAVEFEVLPGGKCILRIQHDLVAEPYEIELHSGNTLIVSVIPSGATFEFVRNGKSELEMPIATPGPYGL